MSFWALLFNRKYFASIYEQNCTYKTRAEWHVEAIPSIPIGVPVGLFYVLFGIAGEIIYIPFLIVMLRKEFFDHSCYKIMFVMGCIDMAVLPFTAMGCGIQLMFGYHYCEQPIIFYLIGCFGTIGWYGVSFTTVILALDRFLVMCWQRASEFVFHGKRVYFWMVLPFFYMLFTLFNTTFVYNTKDFVGFTDPYKGIKNMEGHPHFLELTFHCIHNYTVPILLTILYTALIIVTMIKTRLYQNTLISKQQNLLTIQALCICFEIFIASIVYLINNYTPLPTVVEIFSHVSLIAVHGDTPIVYLCLNKSLRSAVVQTLRGFKNLRRSRVSTTTNFMERSNERYLQLNFPTDNQGA